MTTHRLIGLFVVIASFVVFYFTLWQPISNYVRAKSWAEVPCEVLDVKFTINHGEVSDTYIPKVTCSYQIGGKIYQTDRVYFSVFGLSEDAKKDVEIRFPIGSKQVAFVNSELPGEAVLSRNLNFSWFSLVMFLGLFLFGSILLFSDD